MSSNTANAKAVKESAKKLANREPESPEIAVNREGQKINEFGDNSRQEPISAEKNELQYGDPSGSGDTSGIPAGDKATIREATVNEKKVQNSAKALPSGTPAFVKEHYEEVGDPAIVLFMSLLNLGNRKSIDADVIKAYNEFPNKEDLETNYNNLRGSTVLRKG